MAFSKTKKMKKGLLSCVLAVAMVTSMIPVNAVSVFAAQAYSTGYTTDGFGYRVNQDGETVTITGHRDGTSFSGNLVIPSYVMVGDEKLAVTAINGFVDCKDITSVTLPDTLLTIAGFSRCPSLGGELVIPKSVVSISTLSFQSCTSLEKVTFEKGSQLETIGLGSFKGCTGIKNDIILPDKLKKLTKLSGSYEDTIFANCGLKGTLKVPESMESDILITGNRFSKIINGSNVKVSVLSGADADIYCYRNDNGEEAVDVSKGTYTLSYKDGVKKVGEYTIKVEGNNATILAYDGEGDGGDLIVPSTIDDNGNILNVTGIGDYVYNNKNYEGNLVIPEGITSIGAYAFSDLNKLTGDINIPDSVTSIGDYAFYRCKGFNGKLKLPSNLVSIGGSAFMSCENLTGDLIIPDSVTNMGVWAFGGCKNMTGTLHISTGITQIPNFSLSEIGCRGDLIIPEGVTSIGAGAFRYDRGFDGKLVLPESLEDVASDGFSYSKFEGELILPKNLKKFHGNFSNSFLKKITNESDNDFSVSIFNFNSNVRYILDGDENENTVNRFEAGKTYNIKCNISKEKMEINGAFFRATGLPIEPDVTVTFLNNVLEEGTDYELSYSDNILPGTASVTVKGKGIYEGEKTVEFIIANEDAVNIEEDEKFSVNVEACTYNGKALTPSVTVMYDGKVLEENKDYTIEGYSNNTHAYDVAEVVIKGTNDVYSGVYRKTFRIAPVDINDERVTVSEIADVNYFNDHGRRPDIPTVKFENTSLSVADKGFWTASKSGYYISYENIDDVSTTTQKAAVVIEGFGDFTGTRKAYFNILKLNLSEDDIEITGIPEEAEYTAVPIEPVITIKYGSVVVDKKSNLKIEYIDNINAGKAKVRIDGIGRCEGTIIKEFTITPVDISTDENITVNKINPLNYTKKALTPDVVMSFKNEQLKPGKDYTVTYKNNVKPGEATVTVKGKGNYAGEKTIKFVIKKGDISKYKVTGLSAKTYTGKPIKQKITVANSAVTLKEGTDYKVTYSKNVNVGTATVKITGIGQFSGSISKTFKINAMKIAPVVTLKAISFVYTGKTITPDVTVKYKNKVLKKGTDYTVTYAAGRKNVGRYNVTVKLKGNYSGNKTVTFNINPKGTSISKLIKASKAITAKWTAITAKMATSVISGYQIQLSTNAKFTSGNKTVNVTGAKVSSKKIAKLAGNKKYYVRIRTYKKVGKITFYSNWSKTYNVTTAK